MQRSIVEVQDAGGVLQLERLNVRASAAQPIPIA
jgi:hypothetical protein